MAREGVLVLTQCFPPAVGGIETLMADMAEALAQRADVRVFADVAAADAAAQYEVLPFGGLKFLRRRRKARAADALLAFFANDALRARLRAGAQQRARQNLWQKRVGELL